MAKIQMGMVGTKNSISSSSLIAPTISYPHMTIAALGGELNFSS
jgi:hypothetical protein